VGRPIFIVGPSRSGTSLMRSILNRHRQVWIADETHYFDDLRVRLHRSARSALDSADERRGENYFLAVAKRGYALLGDPSSSGIQVKELRRTARELGVGADAYFEAFCRIQAARRGKIRWGEKTPRHVFRIDEIFEAFHDAQVICMVRDPRGVVASYRDSLRTPIGLSRDPRQRAAIVADQHRASRSYHVALISLLWNAATHAAQVALASFGPERIRLQEYEEVVANPEVAMATACSWLGLDFQPTMLDVEVERSSYSVAEGIRGLWLEPLSRWHSTLTPREIAVIQSCCGRKMQEFGYARERVMVGRLEVAQVWSSVPIALARAVWANRARMGGHPHEYLWKRLSLWLGRGEMQVHKVPAATASSANERPDSAAAKRDTRNT